MTRKESPSGTTSSTSQVANCSTTFMRLEGIDLGRPLRCGSSPRSAASTSSPLATVVSEMPRPNCFTMTLRRRWRSDPLVVGGEADPDGFHTARARRLIAIGLLASNTGACFHGCVLSTGRWRPRRTSPTAVMMPLVAS